MSIDAMKQALEALEKLWQIIDDIDTASDMAKDNDVWYRQRVQHLQQKRWQLGITTDGNKLEGGAMDALRAAIEQAQEPVACQYAKDVSMPEYRCAVKCQYAQPAQQPPRFPTMLRKMWSGGEVQQWIDENWGNHEH